MWRLYRASHRRFTKRREAELCRASATTPHHHTIQPLIVASGLLVVTALLIILDLFPFTPPGSSSHLPASDSHTSSTCLVRASPGVEAPAAPPRQSAPPPLAASTTRRQHHLYPRRPSAPGHQRALRVVRRVQVRWRAGPRSRMTLGILRTEGKARTVLD